MNGEIDGPCVGRRFEFGVDVAKSSIHLTAADGHERTAKTALDRPPATVAGLGGKVVCAAPLRGARGAAERKEAHSVMGRGPRIEGGPILPMLNDCIDAVPNQARAGKPFPTAPR